MASAAVNAANVTKFVAGGSGDNYIPDGFVKTVEKVWLDNYTIAFTGTNATITIATLPQNKKLTGIDILIVTSLTQTNATVGLGWASEADGAAWGSIMTETNITHNNTVTTISLPFGIINALNSANGFCKIGGYQSVAAGTQTSIALKLNNWTMTTGTIKTNVRYT